MPDRSNPHYLVIEAPHTPDGVTVDWIDVMSIRIKVWPARGGQPRQVEIEVIGAAESDNCTFPILADVFVDVPEKVSE